MTRSISLLLAAAWLSLPSGVRAQDAEPPEEEAEEQAGAAEDDAEEGAGEAASAAPQVVVPKPETEVQVVHPYLEERILPFPGTSLPAEPPPAPAAEEAEEVAPVELAPATPPEPDVVLDDTHLVDLPIKKKILPIYPDNLEIVYGSRPIRCTVRAWVDEKGRPLRVAAVRCPDGFHLATLNALVRWRWEVPDDVTVPPGGLQVEEEVGFVRKGRPYFPAATWFHDPRELTADPSRPALLRSGKNPRFPEQVQFGDAICRLELTVTDKGASKDLLVDECPTPHRLELLKAARTWRWYPATSADGEARDTTVVVHVAFELVRTVGRDLHEH